MGSSQTELPASFRRTPLRADLKQLRGLDLHAQYYTARSGGDFFDVVDLGSRVAFLLSDIAGRREQAHVIAAAAQDTFRQRAKYFLSTLDINVMDGAAQLVQEINNALIGTSNEVHFAPTFVGCYDLQLGVLAYINAGGQTAVFRDSDGTRVLPNVCAPMGLFTHLTYEPSMLAFEPGAGLLVVTKGVIESRRGRVQFGAERVLGLLQNNKAESAVDICRATLQATHDFRKLAWYSPHKLRRRRHEVDEDLTALAMVRPANGAVA
jgi:serine phosphatase RsbU (regulator of sigma subunit)